MTERCARCGWTHASSEECKPRQVVCVLNANGERLCRRTKGVATSETPDHDVLNPYQLGCDDCLHKFETRTGKRVVWERGPHVCNGGMGCEFRGGGGMIGNCRCYCHQPRRTEN